MKRYPPTRTSKKQWLYLFIELFALMVLPSLLLMFAKADITYIIGLAVSFGIAIAMCVLSVKDGRKRFKQNEAKTAFYEEMANSIRDFTQKFEKIDYDNADDEQKINYLICALNYSAKFGECSFFLCKAFPFTKDEVKRLLFSISMSTELKEFIENVLLKDKQSGEISRLKGDIANIILFRNKASVFKFHGKDEEVFLDKERSFRCRVMLDDATGKYKIETGTFYPWQMFWTEEEYDFQYRKKEKAIEIARSLIAQQELTNPKNEYVREDVDRALVAQNSVWHFFNNCEKEKELSLFSDYFSLAMADGHEEFFEYRNFAEYESALKKFLDARTFALVKEASVSEEGEARTDACMRADNELYSKQEDVSGKIDEYVNSIVDRYNVYGLSTLSE